MFTKIRRLLFLVLLLFVSGCGGGGKKLQIFPTAEITIKGESLLVEVASKPSQRHMGFRFRKEIPDGTGMVFLFPEEDYRAFIMTDVTVPLGLAFMDSHGIILEIHGLKILNSKPVYSFCRASYALEVPRDWFKRHGIVKGIKVGGLEKIKKSFPPQPE